jgi:NAD(P)-dependent dehydrogenase (short-subunit alcohol dehydrogenase family)
MGNRLQGKVAVVTGGASGIGRASAERFVDEGASVIVADLQEAEGAAVAAALGDAARFAPCDVTEEDAVAGIVDLAVSHFGRLDIMFNNAGIVGAVGPIAETSAEGWDRTVAVLLRSVFLGTKHAARVMVPQRSGVILNTTSIAGVIGGLGPHAYTTCKHGVIGLTRSAASELARSGVRVNAIAPGTTATALTASLMVDDPNDIAGAEQSIAATAPLGFALVADDIAAGAVYLASDDGRAVTGHTLVVDEGRSVNGGSTRFHSFEPGLLAEAGKRS